MKKITLLVLFILSLVSIKLWAAAGDPGRIPDIFGFTLGDNAPVRFGNSEDALCQYSTAQTPDSLICGVSAQSNAVVVAEKADIGYDFAHALQTDPTVYVQSHNRTATEWISISHNGTNGVIDVGTGKVTFPDGITAAITGNADTATALAANPADCAANTFATTIAANGDLTCAAVGDAGVTDALTISGGTVNNSVIGGVTPAAASVTTLNASGAVTFTSATNIGWSVVAGANTACNTTCTNACVFGQNTGDMAIVDCANATADVCVCAGSN